MKKIKFAEKKNFLLRQASYEAEQKLRERERVWPNK